MFGVEYTVMWAESEGGNHEEIRMARRTGHGGPERMPLYCMMAGAQERALRTWAIAAKV